MNANARQVAGTHYKTDYQHWDMVADLGLGYFDGQITKYLSRHHKKNGLQDVEKALHFTEKLLELVIQHKVRRTHPPIAPYMRDRIKLFCRINGLPPREASLMELVCDWNTIADLRALRVEIRRVMDQYCEATPGYVNQDR